jgi:hypothetical protein
MNNKPKGDLLSVDMYHNNRIKKAEAPRPGASAFLVPYKWCLLINIIIKPV